MYQTAPALLMGPLPRKTSLTRSATNVTLGIVNVRAPSESATLTVSPLASVLVSEQYDQYPEPSTAATSVLALSAPEALFQVRWIVVSAAPRPLMHSEPISMPPQSSPKVSRAVAALAAGARKVDRVTATASAGPRLRKRCVARMSRSPWISSMPPNSQ